MAKDENVEIEIKELSPYATLAQIDVKDLTEKKNGLTYLSWTHAFNIAIGKFPELEYEIEFFQDERGVELPWIYDKHLGYMIFTNITLKGLKRRMWLMVSDGANKSMRNEPWTYTVKDWDESKRQNKYVGKQKTVETATMFDINTTIMRCLTKNLALHGLGINIYAGEDLPMQNDEVDEKKAAEAKKLADANKLKLEIKKVRKDIAESLGALQDCGQTSNETTNSIKKHLNDAASLNDCVDLDLLKAFNEHCALKLLKKSTTE